MNKVADKSYGSVISVACRKEGEGEFFDIVVTATVSRNSAESIEEVVAALHDSQHSNVVSEATMDFDSETGNAQQGYESVWTKTFSSLATVPDHARARASFTFSHEAECDGCE